MWIRILNSLIRNMKSSWTAIQREIKEFTRQLVIINSYLYFIALILIAFFYCISIGRHM